ncbi:beta-N-acetylhexosaminidase [Synchytrium microbalum]|uniref:beta-N-acetylhexosaminidase n=1 Tax=Synchytrium microbalum TaxID=1806994 RepID=A0A507C912_9FUNG|nr:beta-N-acetylhexosaminidase [Synchytrium microbalum]TPX38080.1 beta-N-acetylhexosaminidase [Synchytrium microbalum]
MGSTGQKFKDAMKKEPKWLQTIPPDPKFGHNYLAIALDNIGFDGQEFSKTFGFGESSSSSAGVSRSNSLPTMGSRSVRRQRRSNSPDSVKYHGFARRSFLSRLAPFYKEVAVIFGLFLGMMLLVWLFANDPKDYVEDYYPGRIPDRIRKHPIPIPGDVLWPRPNDYTHGYQSIGVHPDLEFFLIGPPSPRLERAFARYKNLTFASGCGLVGQKSHPTYTTFLQQVHVYIELGDDDGPILELADEMYTMDVPALSTQASINATTVYGAIRALETLAQLVRVDESIPTSCRYVKPDTQVTYVIRNVPWFIADSPRYKHRGLLLDTARHYFPVEYIERILDGMSYTKMNVLHWHIVDSQSFPFVSTSFPELSANGAYSQDEVYTHSTVKHLVDYAMDRGIRIIPEFDMPGHAYAWGLGMPNLTVCNNVQPNWQDFCAEPPCGQLDLTNPSTTETIKALLTEISQLFPDTVIHLGADEINKNCYQTPETAHYMIQNKHSSIDSLIGAFMTSIIEHTKTLNKTVHLWEDIALDFKIPFHPSTVFQTWRGQRSTASMTKSGFNVVVTDNTAWYLDCGLGNFISGGKSWCDPFKTWKTMYVFDPINQLKDVQAEKVVGGEVAMWTESVDINSLETVVWPRAAAVAEVLWSPEYLTKDTAEASPRLSRFRDLLLKRGISASPLFPAWCGEHGGCGPSHNSDF